MDRAEELRPGFAFKAFPARMDRICMPLQRGPGPTTCAEVPAKWNLRKDAGSGHLSAPIPELTMRKVIDPAEPVFHGQFSQMRYQAKQH